MRLLVGTFLFSLAGVAFAQQDYRCVIERVAKADNSPLLLKQLQKDYVGKQFTVERRTGMMAGALKNSYRTTPTVIDMGSTDNSYKVVNSLRKDQGVGFGSNAYMLVVNEFERSPEKNFLFADNDEVYFGTCTHF